MNKVDKDGLKYHSFRFGLIENIKVFICRAVGHRINKNHNNLWCNRCGLAYEEIYPDYLSNEESNK